MWTPNTSQGTWNRVLRDITEIFTGIHTLGEDD
jgi:hypothetical protein